MDGTKLKKIKMSLMSLDGESKHDTKNSYIIKVTGEFNIPGDFYDGLLKKEEEDLTSGLVNAMYVELIENITVEDFLGIWIDYNGKNFENAIHLNTLKDMDKFGAEDIDPVYEFFKMTINKPALATGDGEIESVV